MSRIPEAVDGGAAALDSRSVCPTISTTCILETLVSEHLARRAAELGRRARQGSAVDAIVVAWAEPGGTILTGDRADIEALTAIARDAAVEAV